MTILNRIRDANKPGPPEHSVRLRVSATSTVLVGIAACRSAGALSTEVCLIGAVLVIAGMVFSYRTRRRPPGYIKVAAAVAAISLLLWFVNSLSGGQITDITTVEDPLTVLFVGVQAVHSFHVPSRRDLLFTIAGGAALIALAGAQAIDLAFSSYAIAWLILTIWAMLELWRSASGGGRISTRATAWSVGGVGAAAFAVFLLLPAPTVAVRIGFITSPGHGGPLPDPGALAGDSGRASQLSRPGTPAGRSRVGGFLGFANRLDTALRGDLADTVVMRVRAQRPSYWIGQTYDKWDGQSWVTTRPAKLTLRGGSPFYVPVPTGDMPAGTSDLQTFYMATSMPNLVFHADTAHEVWFPAPSLVYGPDGTLVSPIGLGKGAIYTVESYVNEGSPATLRSEIFAGDQPVGNYTQLPHPYPEVTQLAQSVTAGATNNYDRVQALIAWMGAHTRYSTNIPPLPGGADTVDEFLFGNRVGFCEQISTSLAVMLRTLGVPTREAVGYVPDSYNPVTDLYEVRAKDAHAWVQVWFPGHGWQSFDPTAAVPLANPSPGRTALTDVGHALSRIPVAPAGAGIGGVGAVGVIRWWRRRRPRAWDGRVLREMERAGRRAGRHRSSSETLFEYASRLDRTRAASTPTRDGPWLSLAEEVARGSYGASRPSTDTQARMAADARRLRKSTARRRSSARADDGQSLVGLVAVLLVLGGLGAAVAVSTSSGSTRLPSIPSLTTAPGPASSHAQTGISAAAVAACNADYTTLDQALGTYRAATGRQPASIGDLQPYVRELPNGPGFTFVIQSGQLAVATPGHPASPGSANCSFAGE